MVINFDSCRDLSEKHLTDQGSAPQGCLLECFQRRSAEAGGLARRGWCHPLGWRREWNWESSQPLSTRVLLPVGLKESSPCHMFPLLWCSAQSDKNQRLQAETHRTLSRTSFLPSLNCLPNVFKSTVNAYCYSFLSLPAFLNG